RPPVPGVASDPPLIQLIRERRDRRERRGDEPSELTLVRLTARGAEAVPECRGEGRLPNSLGDRSGGGQPSVRPVASRGPLRGGGRECSPPSCGTPPPCEESRSRRRIIAPRTAPPPCAARAGRRRS